MARTSFLARGVDHHRASRVRNTNDRGRKTKNKYGGARLFSPKVTFVLLETKFAYKGGFTCWNNLSQFCVFKKIVSGIQCFPNFTGNSIDRAATENVLRTLALIVSAHPYCAPHSGQMSAHAQAARARVGMDCTISIETR